MVTESLFDGQHFFGGRIFSGEKSFWWCRTYLRYAEAARTQGGPRSHRNIGEAAEKWDFIYKWGFGRRVNGHDEAAALRPLCCGWRWWKHKGAAATTSVALGKSQCPRDDRMLLASLNLSCCSDVVVFVVLLQDSSTAAASLSSRIFQEAGIQLWSRPLRFFADYLFFVLKSRKWTKTQVRIIPQAKKKQDWNF